MSPTNDCGRIDIRYPAPLIAGQLVTIRFEYTVGQAGMVENGRLRIGMPSVAWGPPLVPQYYFWSEYAKGKDRKYTAYDRVNTTAQIDSQAAATPLVESEPRFRKPWTTPQPDWIRDYDRFWITVTAEDAALGPGDKIIVTYGDPSQKPLTARVQGFPETDMCFLTYADVLADGQFKEVPGSPTMLNVYAGPAARIQIVTPSIYRSSDAAKVRIAYTDQVHARPAPTPLVETLALHCISGDEPHSLHPNRTTASLEADMDPRLFSANDPQPVRIRVVDPGLGFEATSNPTLRRDDGYRLFFGVLHAHSQFHCWNPQVKKGISCNTPEECYQYARDIAGLDFCAVTDTGSILEDIWADTIDAAQNMNDPGRFVTFQGTEVGDGVHGDRNVIFAGDVPEPGFESVALEDDPTTALEMQTPRVQQRYAGREDVILMPHHTKMWLTWDCYAPALEPVMEIYSIWGSGEKSGTEMWPLRETSGGAQEAWARGYKIGVVGGSDTHTGLPGRSIAGCDRDDFMIYKAGYAAVWCNQLTRQGIFEALKARRCYATTGVRTILETFIDDHPMGSDVVWPDPAKPRQFRINAWATDALDTINVVKNNEHVHTFRLRNDEAQLVWEDKDEARDGDWYYVRLLQRDGDLAWSSPIWLTVPGRQH